MRIETAIDLHLTPTANVFYQECDITNADAVLAAAAAIKQHFGKSPSILYNNAGMIQSGSILSTPPSRVAKLIAVNLTSHWQTCQAWVPDMIATGKGHIVTMASMASYATVATTTDYAASKAGVLAFHEGVWGVTITGELLLVWLT